MSATPLFLSKLYEGLAPVFFEIFSKKNFGEVLDPYEFPNGRNMECKCPRRRPEGDVVVRSDYD